MEEFWSMNRNFNILFMNENKTETVCVFLVGSGFDVLLNLKINLH